MGGNVLASVGVSGGLLANAPGKEEDALVRRVFSVLAFTGTGTALIVSV